jgi:hypothetical protein
VTGGGGVGEAGGGGGRGAGGERGEEGVRQAMVRVVRLLGRAGAGRRHAGGGLAWTGPCPRGAPGAVGAEGGAVWGWGGP